MPGSKYPSLAELEAAGYPGAKRLEHERQAQRRSQRAMQEGAKRQRESLALTALVSRLEKSMRQNDHESFKKALLDVGRCLKLK